MAQNSKDTPTLKGRGLYQEFTPGGASAKFIEPWVYAGGEGNGTPLQYSCLENPMDGGAWWAAVLGVVKRQTRLNNFTCQASQKISNGRHSTFLKAKK